MFKPSLAPVLFLTVICIFSNPVWAAKMVLQCQTLTSSGRPASTFAKGQKVTLRFNLSIPDQRFQKNADITVKGIASNGGIKIPYKIDEFAVGVPVGSDGLHVEASKQVTVPKILSGSDIDLQVTALVEKIGSVKCHRKISVK